MKKFPLFLAAFLLWGCKLHLVKWKELEIKYKISGTAEGFAVERLKDHGWIWEMESEIIKGGGKEYIPGRVVIHIDYWHKTGYRLINSVKVEIPKNQLNKISWWKAWKATDFKGLVKTYMKLGYKKVGKRKYLGRQCLVLQRNRGATSSVVFLWEKLPLNMPLYKLDRSGELFFEKKAIEIKEVK